MEKVYVVAKSKEDVQDKLVQEFFADKGEALTDIEWGGLPKDFKVWGLEIKIIKPMDD